MSGRARRSSCWSSWRACNRSTSNLTDAARVDGANIVQRFRYVILPHLVPYMLIAASFRGIATMNDFDKIWLLTQGGPGDSTTTITIYAYKIAFSAFDMGRTTAIAWIFVVHRAGGELAAAHPSVPDVAEARHDARSAARMVRKVALSLALPRDRARLPVSLHLDGDDRLPIGGRHAVDALHLHADARRLPQRPRRQRCSAPTC